MHYRVEELIDQAAVTYEVLDKWFDDDTATMILCFWASLDGDRRQVKHA